MRKIALSRNAKACKGVLKVVGNPFSGSPCHCDTPPYHSGLSDRKFSAQSFGPKDSAALPHLRDGVPCYYHRNGARAGPPERPDFASEVRKNEEKWCGKSRHTRLPQRSARLSSSKSDLRLRRAVAEARRRPKRLWRASWALARRRQGAEGVGEAGGAAAEWKMSMASPELARNSQSPEKGSDSRVAAGPLPASWAACAGEGAMLPSFRGEGAADG